MLEAAAGAFHRTRRSQKPGIVVQGQDESVNLEGHLGGIGIGAQVAFLPCQFDGLAQRVVPGPHHAGQRITHRPGPVIEFGSG